MRKEKNSEELRVKSEEYKFREFGGITLVSLVITIIILLILAGVTINLTVGETGIFTRAKQAKEDYLVAVNTEQELLANAELALEGSTTGGNIGEPPELKIGDYVDYDPTKADANKTVDVDHNLLTYTSPKGGFDSQGNAISGNGIAEQKFTALPNDNTNNSLKWRILDIGEKDVMIIPDNLVSSELGSTYRQAYSIGYIFAENELHNICSIYGYGYGANLEGSYEYYVGGPLDTPIKMKTENTAARSITMKDLCKLTNIELNSNYRWDGTTTKTGNYPSVNVYYPSLTGCDKTQTVKAGTSNSKERPFAPNSIFNDDEHWMQLGQKIKEMLPLNISNGSFHIANRGCDCYNVNVSFNVLYYNMKNSEIGSNDVAYGGEDGVGGFVQGASYVLPVVSIQKSVIEGKVDGSDWGTSTKPWKLK